MKIIELQTRYFKGAPNGSYLFDPRINIITGPKGSGKTSLLLSLVYLLTWWNNCHSRRSAPGQKMLQKEVTSGHYVSKIEVLARLKDRYISWSQGVKPNANDHYVRKTDLIKLAYEGYCNLNEKDSQCVVGYLPQDRTPPARMLLTEVKGANYQEQSLSKLVGGLRLNQATPWLKREWLTSGGDPNYPTIKSFNYLMSELMPGYTDLTYMRDPTRMEMLRYGDVLVDSSFTSYEKMAFLQIVSWLRYLVLSQPTNAEPHKGYGILIVDLLEWGLDKATKDLWAEKLPLAFPNCQFFLTTEDASVLDIVARVWGTKGVISI